MSFIAAKCTERGAKIEIGQSKKAGSCTHYGAAVIAQEAVVNDNSSYAGSMNIPGERRGSLNKRTWTTIGVS
ncbi:MAG: hypothetical protein LBM78_04865, partial [Clostridiales bacterium]|nr:hypothetical protein [Clostridiales bacterium]